MTVRIKGDPLWTESPSGSMIYGIDIEDDIKKGYKENNLNESEEDSIQ